MKNQLGLTFLATGALMLAAATACGDGDTAPPPKPSASSSSPIAPPTSDSPISPSAAASSAASRTLRNYFATVDQVGKDPSSALAPLARVATSTQLNAERRVLASQHSRGERQVGDTRVARLKVQSIDLNGSNSSTGQVPNVVIDVCWDVSKVDVLDKHGTSIVSPARPDSGWTRYTVANYHYAADPTRGWRVATGQDLKQKPCTAS